MSDKKKHESSRSHFLKLVDFAAFLGTACVAIALVLSYCLKDYADVAAIMRTVGEAIAYVILILLAGIWARRKNSLFWLILYIIFLVVIVVMYVLNYVHF